MNSRPVFLGLLTFQRKARLAGGEALPMRRDGWGRVYLLLPTIVRPHHWRAVPRGIVAALPLLSFVSQRPQLIPSFWTACPGPWSHPEATELHLAIEGLTLPRPRGFL